jgi:hypothetical protein
VSTEVETVHARDCPGTEFCAGECTLPVQMRPRARQWSCGDPSCDDPGHRLDVDPLCWREEVAALLGVKVATVNHYANRSRAKRRETRKPLPPEDFPIPVERGLRHVVTAGGHDRVHWSSRWRLSAVEAYQRGKRGPGGRPARQVIQ